jgi:hypothetical protein
MKGPDNITILTVFSHFYCLVFYDKHVSQLLMHGQTSPNRKNLARVFNFKSGHLQAAQFLVLSVKLPDLKLKTQSEQLLGSLPLVIALRG